MDKISDKLDTISERLYTVENKMSYIEKQLYLWKLHEQTSNKPRRQQIPQYVAPISRRTHQPPIMNPYFKPPRYKKHVNEAPTQHTNHNARTHQPPSTRPSSMGARRNFRRGERALKRPPRDKKGPPKNLC